MAKTPKQKAWDEFSKFIRTRDCIRTTNTLDTGICVTCSREYPFKSLQAGHFLGGRTNSILLDEDLVHAQCYGCNVGKSGQYVEYFIWMEETYGRDTIDVFRERKGKTLKVTNSEWDARAAHYKARRIALEIAWKNDKYSSELQDLIRLGVTLES